MSGRPYTYSRGQAIAHLMQDNRRDVIKNRKYKQTVYIYRDDLFICYSTTIEWLPRLGKVEPDGIFFGSKIEGWPTEEEITACIEESAQRERVGDGLAVNDMTAFNEMVGE